MVTRWIVPFLTLALAGLALWAGPGAAQATKVKFGMSSWPPSRPSSRRSRAR
jgi:hypothetical protein